MIQYAFLSLFRYRYLCYYYLFLLLLSSYSLFPIDPLLKEPWHKESIQQEAEIYNQLLQTSTQNNPLEKKDRNGRKYFVNRQGKITIHLDQNYFTVFPHIEDMPLHIAESQTLADNQREIDSIRLLKGIELCQSISNNLYYNPEPKKLLNILLSKNSYNSDRVNNLTEPFGCYTKNGSQENILTIQNKIFPFYIELPYNFQYWMDKKSVESIQVQPEYNWKAYRFVKRLGSRKYKEEEMEKEIQKSEDSSIYPIPDRVVLTVVGFLFQPNTKFNINTFPNLVKRKIGITDQYRKGYFQIINSTDAQSEYRYTIIVKGNEREYVLREKYILKNNQGIAFFLNYPVSFTEEPDKIWKQIELKNKY